MSRFAAYVTAILAVLLPIAYPATGQGGATVPKLESLSRETPPAQESGDAMPLPRTMTICQDAANARCWSEPGTTDCGVIDDAGRRLFRTVPTDAHSTEAGDALRECWDQVRGSEATSGQGGAPETTKPRRTRSRTRSQN